MSSRTIIVTDRDFWPLSALVRSRTASFTRDKEHIDKLEEELARSVPVPASELPAGVVTMHSRVRVRDLGTDAARTYTLVFPHEADLSSGRLSVLAPLGTALLGYRQGDEIVWAMPGGLRRVRIESVRQTRSTQASPPSRLADGMKARNASLRRASVAPFDGAA
jgi:regulator of nucleoside diphosphate kinase